MKPNIYDFDSSLDYLTAYLQGLKNEGFGESSKLAKALDVNPSVVTNFLKGKVKLTIEQAYALAQYLELSELESSYLLLLAQHERAEAQKLKKFFMKQLQKTKLEANKVKAHLSARTMLPQEMKQHFYSQWYYSGIRMLIDTDGTISASECARRLNLPESTVKSVLDFLIEQSLLVREGNRLRLGPSSTHLSSEDPLVTRHHLNWREKSFEYLHSTSNDELHFTGPMTIAAADMAKVRKVLLEAIEKSFKLVDKSPSETPACILVDLFRF